MEIQLAVFFASHKQPSLVFSYPVILSNRKKIAMKMGGLKAEIFPEKMREKKKIQHLSVFIEIGCFLSAVRSDKCMTQRTEIMIKVERMCIVRATSV